MKEFVNLLGKLPLELASHILSFLSEPDLCSLSLVCKKYRLLTEERWRIICRRRGIPLVPELISPIKDQAIWKEARMRNGLWMKGCLSRQRLATFQHQMIPKVFMDGPAQTIFYTEGRHLQRTNFRQTKRNLKKERGILFDSKPLCSHQKDILDFSVFNQNGDLLTAGEDGLVIHWNAETGKSLKTFSDDSIPVNALTMDPLSTSQDRFWTAQGENLKLWELSSQNRSSPVLTLPLKEKTWTLRACGNLLAAGVHGKDPLRIFDATTCQRLSGPSKAHRSSVYGIHFDPSNPQLLTTCSYAGDFSVWDLRVGGGLSPVMNFDDPFDEPLYCIQGDVAGSGRVVTGTARHNALRIWDVRGASSATIYAVEKEQSSPVYSLSFDGSRLCAALASGVVLLSVSLFA